VQPFVDIVRPFGTLGIVTPAVGPKVGGLVAQRCTARHPGTRAQWSFPAPPQR